MAALGEVVAEDGPTACDSPRSTALQAPYVPVLNRTRVGNAHEFGGDPDARRFVDCHKHREDRAIPCDSRLRAALIGFASR
jgi:hypothetical protein